MVTNGVGNILNASAQAPAKGSGATKGASTFEDVLGDAAKIGQTSQAKADEANKDTQKQNQRPDRAAQKPSTPAAPARAQSRTKLNSGKSSSPSSTPNEAIQNSNPDPAAPVADASAPQTQTPSEPQAEASSVKPTSPGLGGPTPVERALGAPLAPGMVGPNASKAGAPFIHDDSVNSLTRRVVWNDFLRKMKDELGVSAEDMLKAFTSLTEEELALPPAQAADKVIGALGLIGAEAKTATQYFKDLVSKTHSKSLGEELEASHRQISLTLMSQREMQRKTMQSSLEQMNRNFFMDMPKPLAATALPMEAMASMSQAPLTQQEMASLMAQLNGPTGQALVGQEIIADPHVMAVAAANPGLVRELNANFEALARLEQRERGDNSAVVAPPLVQGQANTAAASSAPAAKSQSTLDQMIQNFYAPQSARSAGPLAGAASAPMAAAPAAATLGAPVEGAASAISGLGSAAGSLFNAGFSAGEDSEEGGEFTSDSSYMTAGLTREPSQALGNVNKGEFQGQLDKVDQPVSISDLVDKAQVMVTDGGGEMKVTLNQEGLGEVAMRVSVEQGKVNVQMITESDEAKKLIERHMHELKGQLTNNQLQVDTIKIDTATNVGKQLDQQYQDAQKQMAQQSMEQFRQDHQGWRRSFFETPGARHYKGQNEAPRDVAAPGSTSPKKANSRRLDLVA